MTASAFLHARQALRDAARAFAFALAAEEEAIRAVERAECVMRRATLTRELAESALDHAREQMPVPHPALPVLSPLHSFLRKHHA